MKKYVITLLLVVLNLAPALVNAQNGQSGMEKVTIKENEKTLNTQWQGKKIAFLGDSMTDPGNNATSVWYWQYLKELLGTDYCVYAKSGYQWDGIYKMANKLYSEKADSIDAIFIWAGTNDYNHNTPLGKFFTETTQKTNFNGQTVTRKHREPILCDSTFCGRINKVMSFLKTHYGNKQIVIMTPIHRAFATFGQKNVQPDENYANDLGLYIDSYIEVLKQASDYWAVPLIDLHSISGLYPLYDSNVPYFHDSKTDRLHPNALGHYRLAKTIQYQLLALPSTF